MIKPLKKEKHFATEADMCAHFIGALPAGWTPYAETAGWDILLVRDEDGFQIGIQAKMKCNAHVLSQALESGYSPTGPGPDCRAIMVPLDATVGYIGALSSYIGITVITVSPRKDHYSFSPFLPRPNQQSRDWYEQAPSKRHDLPEYIPDVTAGAAAPVQLTPWKIGAIKIAIALETRGYVTREDFKAYGIDHRRWVPQGWLVSRGGRMTRGVSLPNFEIQHPKVYGEIKARADTWMVSTSPALL